MMSLMIATLLRFSSLLDYADIEVVLNDPVSFEEILLKCHSSDSIYMWPDLVRAGSRELEVGMEGRKEVHGSWGEEGDKELVVEWTGSIGGMEGSR